MAGNAVVNVLCILQARVSSTRLPGKVLKPILGRPMIAHQIERIRRARHIDHLIVATSLDDTDQPIADMCDALGVACRRGSLVDVLDRYYQAARPDEPDHVVRVTGDCPLTDPHILDRLVELHLAEGSDYSSNVHERTFPDGLDAEIFTYELLERSWRETRTPFEREHVTPYMYRTGPRFRRSALRNQVDRSAMRWTVDYPEDLEFVRRVFEALYPNNPAFSAEDVYLLLDQHPEIATISAPDPGAVPVEPSRHNPYADRYRHSMEWLERAERSIPLGSQTFSKSRVSFPLGVSPLFLERGRGSRVWDADDNEYVDFVSALLAISLGYNDPDVDDAVRRQMENGVIFSLPHRLEMELAERIIDLVPCAEAVRFAKNGSDATAGAVRIARAYTGRDHVAVCGYHGWQDWYIGSTTRDLGVPRATSALTHRFIYNDASTLEQLFAEHPGQIAAVILEPMNVAWPESGFLQGAADITRHNGAVLIFDETITGFRFSLGGAQELFGVTPDLATFGKGLANGLPLSVVTGRWDIMKLMEEAFFSFTFGGEALALAAALAVLAKMERDPVIQTIHARGTSIIDGLQRLITGYGLQEFCAVSGHPSWSFFLLRGTPSYDAATMKTFYLQEMFAHGILVNGTHNISYAHTESDVAQLLEGYDSILSAFRDALEKQDLLDRLYCEPVRPLFEIR